MMMRQLKYWFVATLVALCVACSDDDDFQSSILDAEPEVRSELDEWIWQNFTSPYNIRVIYKWKTFEISPELKLVPVLEDKVQPFLEIVQTVWVEPYLELGGPTFFKETTPKQIALVGSLGFMEDGYYLFGEAERGQRITILGLNTRVVDEEVVRQYAHDFHHEYTHILNQRKAYPAAFEAISAGQYTTSWGQVSGSAAMAQGFISNYAMSDAVEDFAEMVSYFVIFPADTWNTLFNTLQENAPTAYNRLKEKETIMIQYMKNMYNIDMYALRTHVQNAMAAVIADL
jgi:substrate import-associated zinc metallohydrolase lipoprotein